MRGIVVNELINYKAKTIPAGGGDRITNVREDLRKVRDRLLGAAIRDLMVRAIN